VAEVGLVSAFGLGAAGLWVRLRGGTVRRASRRRRPTGPGPTPQEWALLGGRRPSRLLRRPQRPGAGMGLVAAGPPDAAAELAADVAGYDGSDDVGLHAEDGKRWRIGRRQRSRRGKK
jgi:hypothetical protein